MTARIISPALPRFLLVGSSPNSEFENNPGGQKTASEGLISFARSKGISIEIIDTTQSSFPVPKIKERMFRAVQRILNLFSRLNSVSFTGVIIFSSCGASFYEKAFMAFLCRIFRVKNVLFVRSGHFMEEVRNSTINRFLVRLLVKIPFKIGCQGSNWVDFYKKELGVNSAKIVLIHNWLPPFFFQIKKPNNKDKNHLTRFVFVGWLNEEKGVFELAEAIKKLMEKYSFEFFFVGGGKLEGYLKKMFENLYQGKVKILGWQTQEQVRKIMEQSDVFVLPSKAEGFPNALLEAMACGLPAICTDVGAISDSIIDGYNGFLLKNCNSMLIAEAMQKYLTNPELMHTHSNKISKILQSNHNLESNCEKLFKMFTSKAL